MAKIVLSMDGLVLKEIPLDRERLTIGRKPHNDIQIDNLAISGEHAVIVTILADSFLEDLNSTNGTLVNGQSVKKHFLRNNDLIELGKYKLKYFADAGETLAQDELSRSMIRQPGAPLASDKAGAAAEPQLNASPSAAIQLLNGPNAGKELTLLKNLTTLGKPGTQVAVIAKREDGYFITHVEGAQFPLLNGKLLDAQACPLTDRDVIEIAGIKMAFFLRG